MDFPRVVYIVPGPHPRHGGTYGQELVEDQDDFDAAIEAGFYATLPEAIEAHDNPKPKEPEVPSGPKAVDEMSKAELVAKLTELGVEFDKTAKKADLALLLTKSIEELEE